MNLCVSARSLNRVPAAKSRPVWVHPCRASSTGARVVRRNPLGMYTRYARVPATPVYRCWCQVPWPKVAGSGCCRAPPGGCHSSGSALLVDRAGRLRAALRRLVGAPARDPVALRVAARAAFVAVRCTFFTVRLDAAGLGIIALSIAVGRLDCARRATHLPWSVGFLRCPGWSDLALTLFPARGPPAPSSSVQNVSD